MGTMRKEFVSSLKPVVSESSMPDNSHKKALDRSPPDDDIERPIGDVFGIEIHYLPDDQAPPVDLELLGRHIRQQLSAEETVEVCRLIANFRPWHEACTALMRRDLKQ